MELIKSIPQALAETELVCSSVNVGSTRAGINMDAVRMMGQIIRETAELSRDNQCMGAANSWCSAMLLKITRSWQVLSRHRRG